MSWQTFTLLLNRRQQVCQKLARLLTRRAQLAVLLANKLLSPLLQVLPQAHMWLKLLRVPHLRPLVLRSMIVDHLRELLLLQQLATNYDNYSLAMFANWVHITQRGRCKVWVCSEASQQAWLWLSCPPRLCSTVMYKNCGQRLKTRYGRGTLLLQAEGTLLLLQAEERMFLVVLRLLPWQLRGSGAATKLTARLPKGACA